MKHVFVSLAVFACLNCYSCRHYNHKVKGEELISIREIKEQRKGLTGGGNTEWKLYPLSSTPDAKCLDGSDAGFWFSEGDGDGVTKFVIHHMGGGWCTSIENCFDRGQAKTYGSSEDWRSTVVCELEDGGSFDDVKKPTPTPLKGSLPCHADGGMHGLLSPDPAANPMTYNWNKVFIGYCDGASMGGNVDKPVPVPDSKDVVFFRGRAILDAAYDKLLDKLDLNHATDVLVSGSSAGGLTVFSHLDYIADKIKSESKLSKELYNVAGVADAGFFLDIPSVDGEMRMQTDQGFVDSFTFQNLEGTLNKDCVKAYKGEGWKCMLPQYSLQYTKTPIFVVNSFADTYQLPNVMGISGCSKSHCSRSDLHYINSFRRELLTAIDGSLGGKGGYWITDCPVHTIADHSDFYNGVLVDGVSLGDAIYGWYYETFGVRGRGISRGSKSRSWAFVSPPLDEGAGTLLDC